MEQRQLEFFVAVAEELNFTRAAQRTHAVQSTVSASIRALERSVGSPLFERSTAKVDLTPAGRMLLPEARRALDALAMARAAVTGTRDGLVGTLRIGTLSGLTVVDLPALIASFRERHPGVQLTLSVDAAGTEGLLRRLRDRTIDVAFVGLQSDVVPDLQLEPVVTFHPRLLVSKTHALAGRARIRPADLADESFIDLPPGFCNRVRSDNDFMRAGVARRVAVEVSELSSIPGFVETGVGLALVPPLQSEHGADVVAIPLDPPAASWTLSVARLATVEPSRAAATFIGMVDAHVVRRDTY